MRDRPDPAASARCLFRSFAFVEIEALQRAGDLSTLTDRVIAATRRLAAAGAIIPGRAGIMLLVHPEDRPVLSTPTPLSTRRRPLLALAGRHSSFYPPLLALYHRAQRHTRRTDASAANRGCTYMAVTRIVANLIAPDPIALARFYAEVFALDLTFEMGWIAFLGTNATQTLELHTASEGGSGTDLPVISIGVDDLDATEAAVRAAGAAIVYGPIAEAWGLRRFFFRDPAGNLINVVDS